MNSEMPTAVIEWLLQGEPWVEYRARLDLAGQPEQDPQVQAARQAMLADAAVRSLVDELSGWPGVVLASHKSASQPFHKLAFLADLGLQAVDPGMQLVIDRVLAHQSPEGPTQLPTNVPVHYGGTGQEVWAWALCDAPLVAYALVKFGLSAEPAVAAAVDYLASLAANNGWPCTVSRELGSFRGPGSKHDPCPFATLAMLKLLSELEAWRDSPAARAGVECLLSLWEHSTTRHPYMFYMGTDFRKLKAPFIWYDLLNVLDVLSRFPWLSADPRHREMRAALAVKMDPQGRFTPESAWQAWKQWEFGQKKAPSRWLTLCAWRILHKAA